MWVKFLPRAASASMLGVGAEGVEQIGADEVPAKLVGEIEGRCWASGRGGCFAVARVWASSREACGKRGGCGSGAGEKIAAIYGHEVAPASWHEFIEVRHTRWF